uniref:Claudin n=1 Tax=Anser brachyrhynchus TaxID=132585 RepID=A0A8B9CHI3_9AVES
MSAALEIVGFLLCLGGWALIGATLPHNYWKVSSIHGSVITTSTLYENLWKSCAEDSTGVSNCRVFDSMFALNLPNLKNSELNSLCVHAGGIICSFHYSNSYLTIFLASCYPTVGFKMHVCINRTVTDTLHKLLSITTSRMRFFSSAGCSCKYAFGSFITPLMGRFLTYCPRHCTASCH